MMMRFTNQIFVGLLSLASIYCLLPVDAVACTTLVASGRATVDGRPLLWKNRDYWQRHNELLHDDTGKYTFVGMANAGATRNVRMGVNTAGLCVENSTSRDLTGETNDGPTNGAFIRLALQSCATVEEVQALLETTNETGRRTHGNFGVIDAHGGAMMFEISHHSYRAFDANDPEVAPLGFIVRSNFSETARDKKPDEEQVLSSLYSSDRYLRAYELCESRLMTSKLDLEFILFEVCRDIDGPPTCDFGCELDSKETQGVGTFKTSSTLSRNSTVSAVVFQGVKPGESPAKTTMWSILGEPMFSVAIPAWASQGGVAEQVDGPLTSSLCDLSLQLRMANYDQDGREIKTNNLPMITRRIKTFEQALIAKTQKSVATSPASQLKQHNEAVESAHQFLQQLCDVYARRDTSLVYAESELEIAVDFQFEDENATKLAEAKNSAGDAKWSGGMTDCAVHNGALRMQRNKTTPVNRYLDMIPKVRTSNDDARNPKAHQGWIVMEVSGWNLRGATPNELVRIGFSSQPEKDLHTVGLVIERTAEDVVSVSGVAFGDGGSKIESTMKWPTQQSKPVTFVLELDKARGNPDEGDVGGLYRIFYKQAVDKTFTQIGKTGDVRRLRNGNSMHFRTAGFFGAKEEYLDIDRIYYTNTDPLNN